MAVNFGPFRYEPGERALYRGADPVALTPKAVDLLAILLERRGEVVSREELMKLLWPDTTVEDTGLARNVSLLRKTLGDDGETATYIETVPKRGYRFIGELNQTRRRRWPLYAGAGAALVVALLVWQFYIPSRYTPPAGGRPYLAVVPLEMVGAEPRAGFARVYNETYVMELAQSGQVQMLSPTTVQRYQRWGVSTGVMARLVGADLVVEGTLESHEGGVRAAVRVADAHTAKLVAAVREENAGADALAKATLAALKLPVRAQ